MFHFNKDLNLLMVKLYLCTITIKYIHHYLIILNTILLNLLVSNKILLYKIFYEKIIHFKDYLKCSVFMCVYYVFMWIGGLLDTSNVTTGFLITRSIVAQALECNQDICCAINKEKEKVKNNYFRAVTVICRSKFVN